MDTAAVRVTLERHRGELDAELAQLTAVPRDPMAAVSIGKRIGDGTTEAIGRFNDVGVADSLAAIEGRLERALEKLEEGSYGTCDGCGAAIPAGRLRSVPESALCLDCARR